MAALAIPPWGAAVVISSSGTAQVVEPEQAFPKLGDLTAISNHRLPFTEQCGGVMPAEP
jgi:hypothetical protein